MIVHRVSNEHVREYHVQVVDRLEDSNCLVDADGSAMLNSNDCVMGRMELSKLVVDLRYLVSMNRKVSIRFVKLLSIVVGHQHRLAMEMALAPALDVLNEREEMEWWTENLVQQIV